MKYVEFPLFAEGYVNRFLTTGIYTKEQEFTKATLNGRVNEWLKKGFSIHENPCRKEFTSRRKEELPPYTDLSIYGPEEELLVFEESHRLRMYFPFSNIGMEESGFYYRPTYLRSYSYVVIKAEKEESVDFELTTCGGMTLWVNDCLVTDFTPFTRNMKKSTVVTVALKQGENKFIICLDDLAERDTDYYFQIRRMGEAKLSILLPIKDTVSIDLLKKMEFMLEQVCFEKEAYISEPVKLQMCNYCNRPLTFEVVIAPGEFIEKMETAGELIKSRQYRLGAKQKTVELLHSDELLPGYYYFMIKLEIDGIVLKRKIGNQIVRKEFLNYHEESLKARKQHALETAVTYNVDNVYKSAALFKLGRDYEKAEQIIFEELNGVRQRKDCSDFHFIIILYIYHTFSPVITEKLKGEIEETMRNYRYWIDEPGDDVMWFFSENHALLFHCCQYLAGQYLPDQVFTNSGNTGMKLQEKGASLLNEWFDSFFEEFITEWNSNAYIPVDVLGLGTLYNLTDEDQEIHQKAKKALDMIFYALSINEHKGAIMTSFGRTYEKEMKGNYNAGTTGMLYVAYNAGYLTRSVMGYLPLVLGDYEAPLEYKKYLQLTGSQELIHQNTQGFEKHVNLYLYKNADVLLSTAVGFKPFQRGYQEHIVQATIDELAQVFINHPGESHPYGSGRPNFWAGNGVLPMGMQYHNVSILKYDIENSHRIDYTHAYIPLAEFKQYRGETNTIVLEKDGGYIGVKAMNGLVMQEEGPCRHREFISQGRQNVWVLKVAQKCKYKNLNDFFQIFDDTMISMNQEKEVMVTDKTGMKYFIDKENGCYINGEKVYQYPLTVEGILEVKGSNVQPNGQTGVKGL